jgi:hypothetical protein
MLLPHHPFTELPDQLLEGIHRIISAISLLDLKENTYKYHLNIIFGRLG